MTAKAQRGGVRALLMALRVYQGFVSPVMPLGCRFYPSCSNYAGEAIERFGAWRGTLLAARRIWRCRPFSSGGYDPLPGREERKPSHHAHEVARA